jgi:hypothetical protein
VIAVDQVGTLDSSSSSSAAHKALYIHSNIEAASNGECAYHFVSSVTTAATAIALRDTVTTIRCFR